jgi:hypothetical protein
MPCGRAQDCTSTQSVHAGDLIDESGYLRDAYVLAPGDWVLVRPDGYIGAIVSSGEMDALETYLRHIGLTPGDQ